MIYSHYVNIHSVNTFYFIINGVDGYIEKHDGYKYLIFAPKNRGVARI